MINKKIISIISVSALLLGTSFLLAGCGSNKQQAQDIGNGFLPSNGEQNSSVDDISSEVTSSDIILDQNTPITTTTITSSDTAGKLNTELDLDKEIKDMDNLVNSDSVNDLNDVNLSNSQLGL